MTKILFIIPPHIAFEDFVSPAANARWVVKAGQVRGSLLTEMPLGVLSISAYVKTFAAVDVKLLDFNLALNRVEQFDYPSFKSYFRAELAKSEWTSFKPDLVGLSMLFTPCYRVYTILKNWGISARTV